ncbi:hypothetical protein RJ639_033674 [Escallonia herrerae]|uniref:Branchpoint-bridging protein n=1 Tax=Escallonia herrerae TaxID=1293975 RepID=A0AA88X022_9ASTE|nr:hypothetical protein RJ639_033674 [Escallonia herrerae]
MSSHGLALEWAPLQASLSESDARFSVLDQYSGCEVLETVGNKQRGSLEPEPTVGISERRRRSRWDQEVELDGETGEGNRNSNSKRRKSRWSSHDSQLKTHDPVILELNARLLEINGKLLRSEFHDDRPDGERSPSPEPEYNNLGIRINTREVRCRKKLLCERSRIISKLIKEDPTFQKPPKRNPAKLVTSKLVKKLYIPVKEFPTYNFIGIILGPRGNTQKRMEKESGAKIFLRGKGAMSKVADPSDSEDLHVCIEADNQESLSAAVAMVENLLIPRGEGENDHKKAQLQELAKLNGTYKGYSVCRLCNEHGHREFACPQSQSTFEALSCDRCGSISHSTSSCPSIASPLVSNSPSTSGLSFGSTPSTKNKHTKDLSDASLYVGYLPQSVDDSRLRELFSPFGKITEARLIKDRKTSLSKGYGFVKFESSVDAAEAIMRMNGYQMDGKMLAVRVAGRPQLPMYPGPPVIPPTIPSQTSWMMPVAQVSAGVGHLAIPPVFQSQTSWIRLPESTMPVAQVARVATGVGLPSALSNSQLITFDATSFPPPVTSSLNESKNAYPSLDLLTKFPGDPDYPGSEFQSYFAASTSEPSSPFTFSQTLGRDPRPDSWATSQLPR